MEPRDCGNIWLNQLEQWQYWLGTSVWGEIHRPCAPFPVKLVGIDLGMGVTEHLSDLVLVILKVLGGKLRHLNGDSA